MKPREFVGIGLRGFSNVMLLNRWETGLIFLIGIFYNSALMGFGALLGVAAGTIAAFFLGYDKKEIAEGTYGYNGVLVGIAVCFFFQPSPLLAVPIILGAAVSTIITKMMSEWKIPPYTFPFVITTWLLVYGLALTGLFQQTVAANPGSPSLDILSAVSFGFGQVMFQASSVTGALFLIGIAVSSPISACFAFIGSALGAMSAVALGIQLGTISLGIYGFNAVLCGIAFAGKKQKSVLFAILAILLSVGITYWMIGAGIAVLTSPFVFSTWAVLAVKRQIERSSSKSPG